MVGRLVVHLRFEELPETVTSGCWVAGCTGLRRLLGVDNGHGPALGGLGFGGLASSGEWFHPITRPIEEGLHGPLTLHGGQ